MERHSSDLIAFPHIEIINGVRIDLGRMTVQQLVQLEEECRKRAVEAEVDYEIVRDTRQQRERLEADVQQHLQP